MGRLARGSVFRRMVQLDSLIGQTDDGVAEETLGIGIWKESQSHAERGYPPYLCKSIVSRN